jgi:CubicO group peptidase (beta-lactamase class C family)
LYAPFPANSGDKFGYGFGIRTERGEHDELESLGTLGWDGALYTRFWIDPQEELIGIFMAQSKASWGTHLLGKFRVLVYQAIVD